MGWADLNVSQLREATGIPTRTIDRWRSGELDPPAERIGLVADACGVPYGLVAGRLWAYAEEQT